VEGLQKDHAVTALHVDATPISGPAVHHSAGRHWCQESNAHDSLEGRWRSRFWPALMPISGYGHQVT
jgi:hypothetical protein